MLLSPPTSKADVSQAMADLRQFEGLKDNLKKLRSIIEDVIKLGKEAYSLKRLHCYDFEPVKKRCSFSVLLTGMTFEFGFRKRRSFRNCQSGEVEKTLKLFMLVVFGGIVYVKS